MRQLAALGPENGDWDAREHRVFAQALVRAGLPATDPLPSPAVREGQRLIRAIAQQLPLTPEEDLRHHYDHVRQWRALQQRKRDLVQAYKQEKETAAKQAARVCM